MKLKVEVDLDDLWFEDDASLGEQVRHAIISEVKQQVLAQVSKEIKAQMVSEVTSLVREVFTSMVNAEITKLLTEDEIPVGSAKLPLRTIISNEFEKSGWSNPKEQIKKLADQCASEIKSRYDLMFATQIVANMSNHGLLKDEMSKLLLPQPAG